MSSDPRQKKTDQDIATLIRAAGPRPAVPVERFDRVRAAAHETWQRQTKSAARRRRFWIASSVAVAASLILAIGLTVIPISGIGESPAARAGFVVQSLSGSAWSTQASGEPNAVALGDRFAPPTEVHTAGDARLAFRLESGHSVRLDHATRVRVQEGGSLVLDAGAVYVDSGADRAGQATPVAVETPFGRIEEIGTQFEVRLLPDAVRVRLREGAVILRDADGSYPVAVGTEFALFADGSSATRSVPAHDDAWNWVETVAPVFNLEGRSARAFLDWVARERGLRLVFGDEQLARSASEIILAGRLEGVSVDEALDVVLPTCRMSHSVVDGILMIEADPPSLKLRRAGPPPR